MRCPDCAKFVSFDEPNVDAISVDVDGDMLAMSGEIVLPCGECGTDLRSASVELSVVLAGYFPPVGGDDIKIEYEMDGDADVSSFDRYEDKDRHGKPIKSTRYMKKYYVVEASVEIERTVTDKEGNFISKDKATVDISAEEGASSFDDLV
jgi:hypothetical protein